MPQSKLANRSTAGASPELRVEKKDPHRDFFSGLAGLGTHINEQHVLRQCSEENLDCPQPFSASAGSKAGHCECHTSTASREVSKSQSNPLITSYILPGFQDQPLSVGKYYPSNYDRRSDSQNNTRQPCSVYLSSTGTEDSHIKSSRANHSHLSNVDPELRQRLKQYRYDMVVQIRMAARENLSKSTFSCEAKMETQPKFVQIPHIKINAPTPIEPISPQLLPVNISGSVTPITI